VFATSLLIVTAAGCDGGKTEEKDGAAVKDGGEAKADTKAATTAGTNGEGAAGGGGKVFPKDQHKKACEMLTADMVATQLGVEAGALEQMKVGGCLYSWTKEDRSELVDASIMGIFAMDDADRARKRFEDLTKSRTAKEMQEEVEAMKAAAKGDATIDTAAKAEQVEAVAGMLGDLVPEGGLQFEDVPGIGDAARVNVHDGSLVVLLGNMTFDVRAFKGKPAPDLPTEVITSTDIKKLTAAAKENDAKWMSETREQRRAMAIELAKVIVAKL
jgi:hypothetical protein